MAGKERNNNLQTEDLQYKNPQLHKSDEGASLVTSKMSRISEVLSRKKTIIAGSSAVASMPFIAGFAEGLEPRDAILYGLWQWASFGNEQHPLISDETQDLVNSGIDLALNSAGFGLVAKVGYEYTRRNEKRIESIQNGTAEIKPKGEQVILLGGKSSHVVDAIASSTVRYGFIPVLESHEGAKEILFQNSENVRRGEPVYLNLEVNGNGNSRTHTSYLDTHAWDRLKLSQENLIHAENGHRYLLVVGCGEQADKELSLDPQNIDVTHDDLRSALLQLKARLQPGDLVEERDIIDMYIGNANIRRTNAENRTLISDRELAKKTGVDIYIDTWAFVLRELAETLKEGGSNEIAIATTNEDYEYRFMNEISTHIKGFEGCEYIDFKDINEACDDAAWLVYEGASDETFFLAKRLRKEYPTRRIIALIANDNMANYIQTSGVENVEFIYASDVLAASIIGVRDLIKKGYTPQEIQELLDEYAPLVADGLTP